MSKLANQAYVYGQDTQLTQQLDFPKNLESITFNGKDIIFKIKNKQGKIVDIVKQSDVSLTTVTGTNTAIPVTQGRKKIIVKSLGTQVLIQIPCTNGDRVCIINTQYTSCTGTQCGLKCENTAWRINITCSGTSPTCSIAGTTDFNCV